MQLSDGREAMHEGAREVNKGDGEVNELAWTKQSWKCSLSSEAPMRFSFCTAAFTALLMVDSALGHDVS